MHVPTKKEVADFFDVRRALETASTRLAAERATPEQARELQEVLDQGREMLAHGDDPSKADGRVHLHAMIARIADNPLLEKMLANIRRRADWYSPPFDPVMRRQSWEQHTEIVAAIAAHDVECATDLMRQHIDGSRDHLYASLSGEEPTTQTVAVAGQ